MTDRIATIVKTFTFDAAHQLPNHVGKCRQLHGHTYRVEVELTGPIRTHAGYSDEGMVVDFAALKLAWQPLHDRMDHRFLNDVIPEKYLPTTAEHLACFILDDLRSVMAGVSAVRVWETPTSYAEVRA